MVSSPDRTASPTQHGTSKADMKNYKATRVLEPRHLTKISCPDISIYLRDASPYEIVYDLFVITVNPRIEYP